MTNAAQERIDGWWFYERADWTPWEDFDAHTAWPSAWGDADPHGMYALEDSLTNAPAWQTYTNLSGSVTITNVNERPVYAHATGAVSVAVQGLRPPMPVYLVVRSEKSVTFPTNTYFVGGATFQTNRANHFVVWSYGAELYVNPLTTTE